MAKLIYGMGEVSLDGYVANPDRTFGWTAPSDGLHRHAGAEQARAGTVIYGRNMYDLMVYWETADQEPDQPAAHVEYAKNWRIAEKLVVSRSLKEVRSARTRIVPNLSADEMGELKAKSEKPILMSGPTVASPFLNAGLVDEVTGYFTPVVVGSGLPFFKDITRLIRLEKLEEQPIEGGFTFVRYAVRS